ncbi:MAG: hypothetical protein IH917_02865 [Acidobacteria bacterium]|nr:hypothetical protein [Acidobacteriota bacterium]
MIKTLLKGIAVVLAISVVTILFLYLNRTNPYGIIPGRQLIEEEVTEPIEDWSFTEQYRTVTNEVRPSDPYSVNTSKLLVDGVLYISSGRGGESRWAQFLIQDPNMRLRLGTKLYPVTATWVEDPALLAQLREAYDKKFARPPGEERTPEELGRFGFFRIDSR